MPDRKRVIVIMTDTQRTDMLGCYGNADMHTPNLDRLASEGMRFDNAYTCQPVCGPARSAMFTGMFPHSNGAWGNSMPLGDNVKTVGQRLTDNGIRTAYIGKWHLDGGDYFGLGQCPEGWDPEYWYDMRNYLDELTPEERLKSRDPSLNQDPNLDENFTFGHRCSERAIDYLQRYCDESFFLVVSFDEPHHPFVCPRPFSQMYIEYEFPVSPNVYDTMESKPEHQKVWAGGRLAEPKDALKITSADFFGCNSFVDYEIGRVLTAIDENTPDALVIYTSDHGDFLRSHSLQGKGPAMYDEITHIPFIARWPDHIPTGTVSASPTSHIDLVPTIMDTFDLPQPKLLEGKSMLAGLHNPKDAVNDTIFMEYGRYEIDHDGFGGYQPIRAAYDGRYKLSINLMTTDELYDLNSDPEELVNLILSPEHKDIRNRMHDAILAWMNDTRDPFRGYYWESRPWREDAVSATWAYTGMTRQRENEEYEPRQLDYATGLEITEATRKK